MSCTIRPAEPADIPDILTLIKGLAAYERMLDQVQATEADLLASLFPAAGEAPIVHCVLAHAGDEPVGFALYFFNYSTFLGRPGLYLEDLFVEPPGSAGSRPANDVAPSSPLMVAEASLLTGPQPTGPKPTVPPAPASC